MRERERERFFAKRKKLGGTRKKRTMLMLGACDMAKLRKIQVKS